LVGFFIRDFGNFGGFGSFRDGSFGGRGSFSIRAGLGGGFRFTRRGGLASRIRLGFLLSGFWRCLGIWLGFLGGLFGGGGRSVFLGNFGRRGFFNLDQGALTFSLSTNAKKGTNGPDNLATLTDDFTDVVGVDFEVIDKSTVFGSFFPDGDVVRVFGEILE
jgi:hypothetical protein